MTKTLTKHGNSYALVIDKGILELLKITPKTPLNISTDGRHLIISPARSAKREKLFRQALEEVNRVHGRVLKRLAE
ncbi:MAG: AbrB/MazE/SpoVT family DNA-binding domain-containing protein [Candidatus Hydrogenedentota bacterium]|nr:MAG: AbrB/MazE/SpoVT family DNA-binding domain-containing protein [Candidatus Hydrogenedentota bacterium]